MSRMTRKFCNMGTLKKTWVPRRGTHVFRASQILNYLGGFQVDFHWLLWITFKKKVEPFFLKKMKIWFLLLLFIIKVAWVEAFEAFFQFSTPSTVPLLMRVIILWIPILRYLSEPRVLAANTWWLKLISPPSIPYRLQWVLYTNTTEASYVNRHSTGWWLDVIYFAWGLYCWVRIEEYDWWRKPTTIVSLVRWSNSTPRLTCADLPRY